MGIVDRLQSEVPKNDEVVKLRRSRRDFEQESGRYLTPAKKRILQSGALEVFEDLLNNVEGSSFAFFDSEFQFLSPSSSLYFRRNEVTVKFRWDSGHELIQPSGSASVDLPSSKYLHDKSLEVTARADSTTLQVRSASYSMITYIGQRDLFPPLSVDHYNVSLAEPEWRDKNKFMDVIVEALSLGGLTQGNLR